MKKNEKKVKKGQKKPPLMAPIAPLMALFPFFLLFFINFSKKRKKRGAPPPPQKGSKKGVFRAKFGGSDPRKRTMSDWYPLVVAVIAQDWLILGTIDSEKGGAYGP